MPYPMKIQPIDFSAPLEVHPKPDVAVKPILKLKFRRLFEKPFSGVLRATTQDKSPDATDLPAENCSKDGVEDFEPSSVCLAKMVQNFIEETSEKQRCGRKKCNCFNGSSTDSSDDDHTSYSGHACDVLKNMILCSSVWERNLLADTAKIVDKNKISKRKDDICRKIVTDGLIALGYKASICRSKWDKTPSFLAGEYEYVDAIIEGERLIIDIDFRSEFEIARPTKAYRQVLQTLPNMYVGKADRLEKIITVVSEAARQSLKKKGMAVPPWRKSGYFKAKWLSPFIRPGPNSSQDSEKTNDTDDFAYVFSDGNSPNEGGDDGIKKPLVKKWEPLVIRPKKVNKGVKLVTGLASIIEDKT